MPLLGKVGRISVGADELASPELQLLGQHGESGGLLTLNRVDEVPLPPVRNQ